MGTGAPPPDDEHAATDSTNAAHAARRIMRRIVAPGTLGGKILVVDAHPGDGGAEKLKAYWAFGEGRQKWANSPHPYTTLRDLLRKYVSARVADGLAANIFHMAMGYWPGDRKGSNPVGPG